MMKKNKIIIQILFMFFILFNLNAEEDEKLLLKSILYSPITSLLPSVDNTIICDNEINYIIRIKDDNEFFYFLAPDKGAVEEKQNYFIFENENFYLFFSKDNFEDVKLGNVFENDPFIRIEKGILLERKIILLNTLDIDLEQLVQFDDDKTLYYKSKDPLNVIAVTDGILHSYYLEWIWGDYDYEVMITKDHYIYRYSGIQEFFLDEKQDSIKKGDLIGIFGNKEADVYTVPVMQFSIEDFHGEKMNPEIIYIYNKSLYPSSPE